MWKSGTRCGPGRFGSSRKKEAAGAACGIRLAMGFECRFFLKSPAVGDIVVERRAQDHWGRPGQRVQKYVSECRKTWFCGVQAHFEEGVAEGPP